MSFNTLPASAARPPALGLLVDDVLGWTIDDYRSKLLGSAMKRATFEMLQRNARIVRNNLAANMQR